MKKTILVLCIFLAINALSGCSNGSTVEQTTDISQAAEAKNIENDYKVKYFKPVTGKKSNTFYALSVYDSYAVYSRNDIEETEWEKLYLLDTDKMEEELIYDPGEKMILNDSRIGDKYIYWTQGYMYFECSSWEIKSYDKTSKRIETIRHCEEREDSLSLLMPRIDNQGDDLVWLEGYQDSNGKNHYSIFFYNSHKKSIEKLASVNFVDNQYDTIRIRNGYITYVDMINEKWYIKIIDTQGKFIKQLQCDEMPSRPIYDGEKLVYEEFANDAEKRILHSYDFDTKTKISTNQGIALFDVIDDCIFYTSNENIYIFDTKDGSLKCISQAEKDKGHDFPIAFACNDKILIIEDLGESFYPLAIFYKE